MKRFSIAIAADHRGYEMKEYILQNCIQMGDVEATWMDVGTDSQDRVDYPVFAKRAIEMIKDNKVDYAVLLCANGIGMAIAANRFDRIYAGVAWSKEIAESAKEDDNINVLVLPAEFVTQHEVCVAIEAWLSTEFKEGRYGERLKMIDRN